MTIIAPAATPKMVLLVKAQTYSHAAGYYLLNGRWHKLHADKPTPKSAPIAAHPHAAGQYVPAAHLTDAEWSQLKLPAENVNAGTFNKQIDKMQQMAESGHVTGILGMQYGVNTYGKKLAIIANHILEQYGSDHKVTPGQKAGDHHAVKVAPAAANDPQPAPAPNIEPPAPNTAKPAPNTTGLAMPQFIEGKKTTGVVAYYEKAAAKVIASAEAGDAAALADMIKPDQKSWQGKTANSKALLALHAAAVAKVGGKVDAVMAAPPQPQPEPEPSPIAPVAAPVTAPVAPVSKVAQIPWDTQLLPVSNSNAKSHNGKVAQIKAMADAGDLAGLEAFKAGKNTYGKKQMQLAALSIAALKESAPAGEPTDAIEDGKPVKPDMKFAPGSSWGVVLDQIEEAIEHNQPEIIEDSIATTNGLPSAGAKAVNAYAHQALAYLQGDIPTPVEPKAAEPVDKLNAEMATAGNTSEALAAAKQFLTLNGDHVQNLNYATESLEAHGFKIASETLQQEYGLVMLDDDDDEPHEPETPTPISAAVMTLLVGWVKKGKPHDPALSELFVKISEEDKASILSIAEKFASGPKDGDTKQGADGMLVFKDGHWHKVEQPVVGKKLKASEAIAIGKGFKTASGMKANLKAMAVAGDVAALQKFIDTHPNHAQSKKYAASLISAMTGAATSPAAKAAPIQVAANVPAADPFSAPQPMDGWKQIGPQGGTNPGGKFVDDQGVEWYCKFPKDEDIAKSEVLAAQLYAAAGIAGQDAKLITKDGKVGIASKWTTVSKASPAALKKADGVVAGFAVDAWLGNWDVVGLEYDNLQLGADGKAVRVDAGGSLQYRAQGGKKAFGNSVIEIDSLRDAAINSQSAAVFGKISKADITASVSKVLGVSDSKIHALVQMYGPGDAAAKQALAETLIARKADLAEKFPKAKKEKKVKPFKAEKISAPPSFLNWGGGGKSGPSSKEFLNEANEAAVQAIYGAAQTGQLDAVQALTAPTFNKDTGEVVGNAPVLEHPSQHVKGYAQQAINEINYQLNPPKRFRFEGGHPLHSLNSSYPSHKGPLHSAEIQKVGKFILLGEPGTVSLDALALPKITYASGALTQATYSAAAKEAIAKMPATQRQAIKSYTGSGYHDMNSSLWNGNASGAAQSAGEALHTLGHEIKPGTVLSRKVSVSGTALDQILKSSGKVLQEPAIMSTSIRPSSWSGNVQLKMHVGPGVKGLWVGKGSAQNGGGLSNHSGEDEMVLPPNTRLLILSVKQSTSQDADGFGGPGIQHVIEAVILPSQANA